MATEGKGFTCRMALVAVAVVIAALVALAGCASSGASSSAAAGSSSTSSASDTSGASSGASGASGASGSSGSSGASSESSLKLSNVSYDPTRELYAAYNKLFAEHYKAETGVDVEISQSHGGSGAQARSVIAGEAADVVTLALAHDITRIEEAGLIDAGWEDEFAGNSSPYTSTIVFLVRAGNPKGIADWDDVVKDGVEIIYPSPKSSGAACWGFLAAWNFADKRFAGNEAEIMQFMTDFHDNVIVSDSGARGATTTFVEKGLGDVLISWENEALASVESAPNEYEIVTPSISILAQPSVAIVDANARENGTEQLAREYLEYLYSDEAQQLIGECGYRPLNEEVLARFGDKFDLGVNLCTIDDFGGWSTAYKKFFADGGIVDKVYGLQRR